jgi:hypothetical protein
MNFKINIGLYWNHSLTEYNLSLRTELCDYKVFHIFFLHQVQLNVSLTTGIIVIYMYMFTVIILVSFLVNKY